MESSFLPWAWGHFRPESLRWVRGVQPQRSKALLCREGFLCLLHCLQCYCFGVNGKLEVREVSWNFRCWLVAWAGLIGAYASHVGNSDCSPLTSQTSLSLAISAILPRAHIPLPRTPAVKCFMNSQVILSCSRSCDLWGYTQETSLPPSFTVYPCAPESKVWPLCHDSLSSKYTKVHYQREHWTPHSKTSARSDSSPLRNKGASKQFFIWTLNVLVWVTFSKRMNSHF